MPQIFFSGGSDVGLKRQNNEDAFVVRPDRFYGAVADGMGGAAAGEEASRIFVETAEEVFSRMDAGPVAEEEGLQMIQKTFLWANDRMLEHVRRFPDHTGMGCTAELLAFFGSRFALGHMGDSRTYRLRNGQLRQLSKDHSFVQEQLDQGIITEGEARNHRMRNVVLRAVGVKRDPALDLVRGDARSGDRFLLCSDGLTDMVGDDAILDVLASEESPRDQVDRLIEMAKAAGGSDNITVAIAQIG